MPKYYQNKLYEKIMKLWNVKQKIENEFNNNLNSISVYIQKYSYAFEIRQFEI